MHIHPGWDADHSGGGEGRDIILDMARAGGRRLDV
jgi:hypothetical protein